jgi:hypothetical protein
VKLKGMWKVVAIYYSTILVLHLSGSIEKRIAQNLNIWCQDLNPELHEFNPMNHVYKNISQSYTNVLTYSSIASSST